MKFIHVLRTKASFVLCGCSFLFLLIPFISHAQTPTSEHAKAAPRIALVLGGGGARGAAHIGVLEVLERERIPLACIVGTSMGGLVAGGYAAGLSPAEMREKLDKNIHADCLYWLKRLKYEAKKDAQRKARIK